MDPSKRYQFINFVKESKTSDLTSEIDGKDIKQFYEDLISEPPAISLQTENDSTESVKKQHQATVLSAKQQKISDSELRNLEKEYLKSAQSGDIKTIEKYIESDHDINVLDSYNWSALMIAVASRHFDIVRLLLENNIDVTIEDNAGNNAYKLAVRLKNDEIRDLIVQKALEEEDEEEEESDNEDFDDTNEELTEHCEICDKSYSKRHEKSHITSIVHIINENRGVKPPNIVSYGLKSTNKGYQMLVKSGWNEVTGLGSLEQGRIYPINAKKKEDRYGIGIDKKRLKAKKSLFGSLEAKAGSTKTVFKSLKDFKKSDEKLKKFERNFRQYYDA